MEPDQISKLPPELRKAAEKVKPPKGLTCPTCERIGFDRNNLWAQQNVRVKCYTCGAWSEVEDWLKRSESPLTLALTWGLQVVEERDRVEGFLNTERHNHGVSILAWEQLETDVARAARLMPSEEEPEENAPWMVPAEPEPMGPFGLTEAIAAMMEMLDREMRKDEKTIDTLNAKIRTAEATIATLTRLCELQDQLLICYRLQTRPTEGLLTGIRKAKAALSHTPEGGGK